jgi:LCP family protein required for cell wall assembly
MPTDDVPTRPRRRRSLVVWALGALAATTALAAVLTMLVVDAAHTRLDQQVVRVPGVFDQLQARPSAPPPAAGEDTTALNILVIGSDQRPGDAPAQEPSSWIPGSQRSDTLMLLHLAADRRSATVVSIPRDSWVEVPGHGMAKVNAAFSWGGPGLAVATVERLTALRVDHVAWIGWDGFRALTDLVGGIDVWVPSTVRDSARGRTWERGMHHLDGDDALDYVRQRYGLRDGDLDRVRRQHYFLRAMLDSFRHHFSVLDPFGTHDMLDVLTAHLSVDDGLDRDQLEELLFDLLDLTSDDVDFLTAPVAGLGREGSQSVVYLDGTTSAALWRALQRDRAETWVEDHRDQLTGAVVS